LWEWGYSIVTGPGDLGVDASLKGPGDARGVGYTFEKAHKVEEWIQL
jgi:hypothetical protein